jgi:cell envelope opacity-associated protein A
MRLIALAVSCLAIGGAASAIATAGAATPAKQSSAKKARATRAVLTRAVHGNLVLATKKGFVNVTFDRGTVQSVQGQQLTLVEGNQSGTHKTVTLTVPKNAVVRVEGKKASLSAVKAGQRVRVVEGLKRARVTARTPHTP